MSAGKIQVWIRVHTPYFLLSHDLNSLSTQNVLVQAGQLYKSAELVKIAEITFEEVMLRINPASISVVNSAVVFPKP